MNLTYNKMFQRNLSSLANTVFFAKIFFGSAIENRCSNARGRRGTANRTEMVQLAWFSYQHTETSLTHKSNPCNNASTTAILLCACLEVHSRHPNAFDEWCRRRINFLLLVRAVETQSRSRVVHSLTEGNKN